MKAPVLPGLFTPAVSPIASPPPQFDGATYAPQHDQARLTGQILRIFEVIKDGGWWTVAEIHAVTGDPENSIQAQLRNLRKPRFGRYDVEKRHRGDRARALYEYRLRLDA